MCEPQTVVLCFMCAGTAPQADCWVNCRLGHLLSNVLCPRAVLALTATATPPTRACIRQLLGIPADNQVVESPLRDNLRLRVLHCNGASKGGGIAAGVVQLLTTGTQAPSSTSGCLQVANLWAEILLVAASWPLRSFVALWVAPLQ